MKNGAPPIQNIHTTATFYFYMAAIGITVGSHRLWAHRAFEAKFPLRLFLMLAQASAGVVSNSLIPVSPVLLSQYFSLPDLVI